jgi:hypothetical protein
LNYDRVFKENDEIHKQHSLFPVKFKELIMDKKDANLWWDVMQDIDQKDIGKVCKIYERNENFYKHRRFHMEKVVPSF